MNRGAANKLHLAIQQTSPSSFVTLQVKSSFAKTWMISYPGMHTSQITPRSRVHLSDFIRPDTVKCIDYNLTYKES